jgi:hypothetical protein
MDIAKNGVYCATLRYSIQLSPQVRFAGALIRFFAGTRDLAIFDLAFRRAEHKLNMPAVLARMADDARSCLRDRHILCFSR